MATTTVLDAKLIDGTTIKIKAYSWKTYRPEMVRFDVWIDDALHSGNVGCETAIGIVTKLICYALDAVVPDQ